MTNERLHNTMKVRRAEKGITQAQLAEQTGVTRKTINSVENGIFVPSAVLALKIARALETTFDTLFSLPET
ncbi:helix-turn-helix transcriptional regulator [Qipengyuania marisflavi]|uniref:Helix-turn-helix transcriptional regulator n=1 Tax=Qipengyuania marisflavi TaxID=2486356 RepID=A0A5S3P1C1_9SPHN|nr:helix-turn-helix transcriptional regulator [Qipengyuania marisflavi]TMM46698.1 helix-turn-helix transcriptional regulator [Qipengyuania marisflavi]